MKKIFNLAICVMALMFASCEEEEPATSRKVETGKVSEITLTSATFHGVVNVDISQYNNVTFGIMLSDSKAELNERGGEIFKAKALIGTDFKIEIGNLETETKYYYCAWLFLNSTQYEFGDIKEFETLAPSLATVITNPITMVMTNSAVAGGCVKDDGGASVTERGVVYSLSKEPTTSNYKVKSGSGVGEYTCNLTNLQDNAIYYVRAYAINSKGTVYGEERYFTTKEITLPSVYTLNATDVSYTSASVSGNVTDDGNAEVTERGIVYSKTQNPTTSDTKKRNASGTGSFTCNLTDLQDGVTYYVRAYATNLKGTAYGEEKSFTTKTINLPTVSTKTPSNISYTSATVDGYVSNDGGANVIERGVVYSTSKEPTTSNNKVKNGSGTGSFSCNLSNLQDGVTYYVRAYAINLKGTTYGEQLSFSTPKLENGHDYVDLGLSVKWATCNVGATKPEHRGGYFAWGETESRSYFDTDIYKWGWGYTTKYNDEDDLIELELSDDAAHVNWGGNWRMPTRAEFDELLTNCVWSLPFQNDVEWCKVTSKINGNSIILPYSGYRSGNNIESRTCCCYWSSSLCPKGFGDNRSAWHLCVGFSISCDMISIARYYGMPIRPVCP